MTESRFLIKKSIHAVRANTMGANIPSVLVIDNRTSARSTGFFVWGVKARQIETTEEYNTPYSMSMFTSDDIDVQLEKDGEFISAAAALEKGTAHFEGWEKAYARVGLLVEPIVATSDEGINS